MCGACFSTFAFLSLSTISLQQRGPQFLNGDSSGRIFNIHLRRLGRIAVNILNSAAHKQGETGAKIRNKDSNKIEFLEKRVFVTLEKNFNDR